MLAIFRSLRGRLAILVLATSIPAIAVIAYLAMNQHSQAIEQAQREAFNAAKTISDELDYIVRTSEPAETLSMPDVVRAYKRLGNVEKAFRTFKGMDLRVRPIHHRLEDRVRAHLFLCMLAYYIEWHMRIALAPLLYVDEDLEPTRTTRDPVARAEPSAKSQAKRDTKTSEDGWPLRRWDGCCAGSVWMSYRSS